MKKKKKFEVGDKIVEFGQVFKIFKIKKVKNSDGKLESVIFFKPCYTTNELASIVCSIPVKNIEKAEIRRSISQKKLKELIKKLRKKTEEENFSNINEAKELLKSSDPADTVKLLKRLWKEKNKESENFSKSKRDLFNSAMERLVQEFALVSGVSLEKARKRIKLTLRG